SNSFEDQLAAGAPPVQRLKRLVELQNRVLRSGFQDVQKNQIAQGLDQVAIRIEDRARLLVSLEVKVTHPVERPLALLKLFTGSAFSEGELYTEGKRVLLASLSRPGFLAGYIAQTEHGNAAPDHEKVLAALVEQLGEIGITPEEGLRALAA